MILLWALSPSSGWNLSVVSDLTALTHLGTKAPDRVKQTMKELFHLDSEIPGLCRDPNEDVLWRHLHRCYCCLLGMSAWGGHILQVDKSSALLRSDSSTRRSPTSNPRKCIREERSRQKKQLPAWSRALSSSTQRPATDSMPPPRGSGGGAASRSSPGDVMTCNQVCFMPPRTITKFAYLEYASLPTVVSELVDHGIVVQEGLLTPFMASNDIYDRLVELTQGISGGITVGLYNSQNVDRTGAEYEPGDFNQAFTDLFHEIEARILPALQGTFGPMSLVRDASGNTKRSVYFRLKTANHYTEHHSDLSWYPKNIPHLSGVAYRCYTVWLLISNSTNRAPLQFRDGNKTWHDGPSSSGDIVVFNSAIEHQSLPPSFGRRASFDFRVLLKDKTYYQPC